MKSRFEAWKEDHEREVWWVLKALADSAGMFFSVRKMMIGH
jgi:hypothetical protein